MSPTTPSGQGAPAVPQRITPPPKFVGGTPGATNPSQGFEQPLQRAGAPRSVPGGRPGGLIPSTGGSPITPTAPASLVDACYSQPTVSVNIGVGFGYGYGRNWYCPPPGSWSSCFTWGVSVGYPDPFCYAPYAYGSSVWACDPWRGYYVRSWNCWPTYWWYPSSYYRSYACGPWFGFRYSSWDCDWRTSFGFSYTPIYTSASCGLFSPSICSYGYDSNLQWSTNGLYKYGWITAPSVTVFSTESTTSTYYASASLPEPAFEDTLRSTTARQLGDTYLRLGDLPSAIRIYGDHVAANPGDVRAMRSLGVALIESGDVGNGVDRIERAYLVDPRLAQESFNAGTIGSIRLQSALDAATLYALDANTPRGWLAVTILMQAQGSTGPARGALERARDAGLNDRIVEWMAAAIPASQ